MKKLTLLFVLVIVVFSMGTTVAQDIKHQVLTLDVASNPEYKTMQGVWEDNDTQTRFTFVAKGSTLAITSGIDDDGELFEIHSFEYLDGRLSWTYKVPSTGYFVTIIVMTVNSASLETVWGNSESNSGQGTFSRIF